MMPSVKFRCLATFVLLLLFCLLPAAGIEAALGEVVPLEGYSSGSNYVYLFLTGPNLPANGVQLNDITRRADQGHFTKVAVDSNDHWSYKWSTTNVNGRLDAGTYTIWVVNGPNDLSNLAHAEYRTLSVTLGKPSVSVDSVQQNGAMEISSNPSDAIVKVNDVYKGRTPLSLSDLPAGTYTLAFSLDGYYEFTTPVRVEAGRISEVNANLVRVTATTATPVQPSSPASDTGTVPPAKATTTRASGLIPAVLLTCMAMLVLRHPR